MFHLIRYIYIRVEVLLHLVCAIQLAIKSVIRSATWFLKMSLSFYIFSLIDKVCICVYTFIATHRERLFSLSPSLIVFLSEYFTLQIEY